MSGLRAWGQLHPKPVLSEKFLRPAEPTLIQRLLHWPCGMLLAMAIAVVVFFHQTPLHGSHRQPGQEVAFMSLAQLVYISDATRPFDGPGLEELVRLAAVANGRQSVTGVLIYGNSTFLQLLEGDQLVVYRLFEKIKLDPRHTRVRMLACYPIRDRSFEAWNMQLLNLSRRPVLERNNLLEIARQQAAMRQGDIKDYRALIQEFVQEFQSQLNPASASRNRVGA